LYNTYILKKKKKGGVEHNHTIFHKKTNFFVILGCSSTGQVLDLLLRGHMFESHKPWGHWKLTWSLTSGPIKLVELRASWFRHHVIKKREEKKPLLGYNECNFIMKNPFSFSPSYLFLFLSFWWFDI